MAMAVNRKDNTKVEIIKEENNRIYLQDGKDYSVSTFKKYYKVEEELAMEMVNNNTEVVEEVVETKEVKVPGFNIRLRELLNSIANEKKCTIEEGKRIVMKVNGTVVCKVKGKNKYRIFLSDKVVDEDVAGKFFKVPDEYKWTQNLTMYIDEQTDWEVLETALLQSIESINNKVEEKLQKQVEKEQRKAEREAKAKAKQEQAVEQVAVAE